MRRAVRGTDRDGLDGAAIIRQCRSERRAAQIGAEHLAHISEVRGQEGVALVRVALRHERVHSGRHGAVAAGRAAGHVERHQLEAIDTDAAHARSGGRSSSSSGGSCCSPVGARLLRRTVLVVVDLRALARRCSQHADARAERQHARQRQRLARICTPHIARDSQNVSWSGCCRTASSCACHRDRSRGSVATDSAV